MSTAQRGGHLPDDWWPAPLPDNVEIGNDCYFWSSYAFQHYRSRRPCGVRLADGCSVYEGSMFNLGPDGEIELGRFSGTVGAIFDVNRRVEIGEHVLIAHDVYVADRATPVPPTTDVPVDETVPDRPIIIADLAWIGAGAVILAGARIGRGAIVGAGTVVVCDVPDYAIIAGEPARIVGSSPPRGPR